MISAHEARNLLKPSEQAQKVLAKVEQRIRDAAANKKTQIKLRDELFARGGYSKSCEEYPLYNEVVTELKENGFEVDYFFESCQFVDAGIIVSWEEGESK